MERVPDVATAVEQTVESLVAVLERARLAQSPAVPPAQLRLLTIVEQHRDTNMTRLAGILDVVPSSASRLCDRLEATGLLRRIPDPRDRREVRVELTPAATRLLEDWRERRRMALAEVLAVMSPAHRAELMRSLAAFDTAATPAADRAESADLRTA